MGNRVLMGFNNRKNWGKACHYRQLKITRDFEEFFDRQAQKIGDEIYLFSLWSSEIGLVSFPLFFTTFFEQTSYFKLEGGDGFCVVLLSFLYFKLELEFGMFLNNIMLAAEFCSLYSVGSLQIRA